jgi:hypothetical protein
MGDIGVIVSGLLSVIAILVVVIRTITLDRLNGKASKQCAECAKDHQELLDVCKETRTKVDENKNILLTHGRLFDNIEKSTLDLHNKINRVLAKE